MTPPYHLRPNKAIDRFLLIEVLKRAFLIQRPRDYTYFSLSGAFLEDAKLVHQFFPDMNLVSIEDNPEEFKRQQFHRFCRHIELRNLHLKEFLDSFEAKKKQVFWIDYPGFDYESLTWFGELLTKVSNFSIVRITIPCSIDTIKNKFSVLREIGKTHDDVLEEAKMEFESMFGSLIGESVDRDIFMDEAEYRNLLQNLIRIQAQRSLPAIGERTFQILSSTYYKDTVGMLSVTGIVLPISEKKKITVNFKPWKFANLTWKSPLVIKVPVLSIQERLHLQQYLPLRKTIVTKKYLNCLGYHIGDNASKHKSMMEYYADFYSYYPYFAKISV